MKITKELIEEKYNEYNKAYFNNELPKVKFTLNNGIDYAGMFTFRKNKEGKVVANTLSLSRYCDFDENTLKEVILHEMIHVCLSYKGSKTHTKHGKDFVQMCEEFEKKYNIHIGIGIDVELNKNGLNKIKKERENKSTFSKITDVLLFPLGYILNKLF